MHPALTHLKSSSGRQQQHLKFGGAGTSAYAACAVGITSAYLLWLSNNDNDTDKTDNNNDDDNNEKRCIRRCSTLWNSNKRKGGDSHGATEFTATGINGSRVTLIDKHHIKHQYQGFDLPLLRSSMPPLHRVLPPPLPLRLFTPKCTSCEGAAAANIKSTSSESRVSSYKSSATRQRQRDAILQHRRTIRRIDADMTKSPIEQRYAIHPIPLGEGAFGAVYRAVDRRTGDRVAVKKISKKDTNDASFQREINALLRIKSFGGHPNIAGLRETYDDDEKRGDRLGGETKKDSDADNEEEEGEGGFYYLVLDLVSGGEMFDHLINNGAYSEADAARLMREVGAALAHLHGIGVVHADLKPENLMLSTKSSTDAVIKVVDFGSADVAGMDDFDEDDLDYYLELQRDSGSGSGGFGGGNLFLSRHESDETSLTPAYCPPEVLDRRQDHHGPSRDMWALGIILYIMLTGLHPFDLQGNSTDEVVEERIRSREPPPLSNSPITAHLSPSAIDVIQKLLDTNEETRIDAHELLNHPWVRGETARRSVMADSDVKLSMVREEFKRRLEAKVFENMFTWSENENGSGERDGVSKRASLIERAFQSFDVSKKGYLTKEDFSHIGDEGSGEAMGSGGAGEGQEEGEDKSSTMSLSGFADLLSENMKNKYFPRGHVVYKEGDVGNHMYFINSGTIEVYTKEGTRDRRGQGDFFGEGALLHPKKIRSASIRCVTPVHAIEISREYFEKYLASSERGILKLNMREKDKTRKRNRAKTLLRLQNNLDEVNVVRNDLLFSPGQIGKSLFILEEGVVEVNKNGHTVFTLRPGDITGEHSLVTGRPRNCTAKCVSRKCKLQEMKARDFYALLDSSPAMKESLREICLRREFQKALCVKTKKAFPNANDLKEAFDAVDENLSGTISLDEVRNLLHGLDESISEEEIKEVIGFLDLSESGHVNFDEFKRIFGMDEK